MEKLLQLLCLVYALNFSLGAAEPAVDELKAKAIAGDIDAQVILGGKYDSGAGVKRSLKEAAKWYEMAAKAGSALGQNNLGSLYLRGEGVRQDYARAIDLFQKSAAQGQPDAMCSLGLMYDSGFGVPKDPTQANAWYRKAAENEKSRWRCIIWG